MEKLYKKIAKCYVLTATAEKVQYNNLHYVATL